MISKMTTDQKLNLIKTAFLHLAGHISTIEHQIAALEQGGEMYYATEWWKDEKYLYLVFPTDQDGKRKRQYIGCDQQKITEARQKITRWQNHQDQQKELRRLQLALASSEYDLTRLAKQLKSLIGDTPGQARAETCHQNGSNI